MKPNFFINCTSIEDVKQLYKKLALLHHPDKGGDTLTLQQINAKCQQILKEKSFSFDNEDQEKDFIIYPELIRKFIILDQTENTHHFRKYVNDVTVNINCITF